MNRRDFLWVTGLAGVAAAFGVHVEPQATELEPFVKVMYDGTTGQVLSTEVIRVANMTLHVEGKEIDLLSLTSEGKPYDYMQLVGKTVTLGL